MSCQSQKLPVSWLSDTWLRLCAHPATRGIILYLKPNPSGAQVDFKKPHRAFRKHCLSRVWRRSPDRHDKQVLCEWQRKVPLWAKQQKIFTVMYSLAKINKKKREPQKMKSARRRECGWYDSVFQPEDSAEDARREVTFSQTVSDVYGNLTTSNGDWCHAIPPP